MPARCVVCGAPLGPDEFDICDICLVYYPGDDIENAADEEDA